MCWEVIEDVGYILEIIVLQQGENKRQYVGVFVGVMYKDYFFIGVEVLLEYNLFFLLLNYV